MFTLFNQSVLLVTNWLIFVPGGGDPSYLLIFWSGMFRMFVGIMYGVAR